MPKTFQCALVGMHFRPPAKTIVEVLPAKFSLHLLREPDNQYDQAAVQVLCRPGDLFVHLDEASLDQLRERLPLQGSDLDELLLVESLQLGYLGASDKLIEPGQQKNFWIAELLDAGAHLEAEVCFSVSGKPSVLIRKLD